MADEVSRYRCFAVVYDSKSVALVDVSPIPIPVGFNDFVVDNLVYAGVDVVSNGYKVVFLGFYELDVSSLTPQLQKGLANGAGTAGVQLTADSRTTCRGSFGRLMTSLVPVYMSFGSSDTCM